MKFKSLLLASALGFVSFSANALTEITIYDQNLALLKKSNDVYLSNGVNEVVFDEVAKTAKPESVVIYGDNVKVLEQNFDYQGINYVNLLKANVGRFVKTLRTGDRDFVNALLVAVDGVNPILKFEHGIESKFDGQVVFDEIPLGLNNNPVLKAKIETAQSNTSIINLAYMANGFDWSANYVAKVLDDKKIKFLGRVALNNNSGSSYENVSVNLVAGDVNVVKEQMPRLVRSFSAVADVSNGVDSSVIATAQSLNGFYLYTLPFRTELVNGQMKMVSFVDEKEVGYVKNNVLNSSLRFGLNGDEFKNEHPLMNYSIKNVKEDGLGMPLPKGKISFYDNDKNGNLQFVGEDNIVNTAEGEVIELQLGKNFDVFANGVVKNVKKISERKYKKNPTDRCVTVENMYVYDVVYDITNSGKYAVDFVLKQPLYNDAEVIRESIKGEKLKEGSYQWNLNVKPEEKISLEVGIQAHLDVKDCM